jgi:drug/metabolite transporter (DMT)-like permease
MPKRAIGSLYLVATATGWALGWSAMKLLMRDWPPLFSRGVAGIAASLDFGALTATGWAALAYTVVVGMTICYLTWFATLRYLPPAMASTGMLLVPLIGVVSAALIFGEPLGWREATSMALTLGGVTLALQSS